MDANMGAKWLSELSIDGMYEEPGYLKPWYFMLRVFEEIARSKRYERPLTLMTISVGREEMASLQNSLPDRLRATDLLCRDANGQHFVLLPETTSANASSVAGRLTKNIRDASVSSASLPDEADVFALLVDRIAVEPNQKAA